MFGGGGADRAPTSLPAPPHCHPHRPTVTPIPDDRGDLPVFVTFTGAARQLQWRVGFDLLDYSFYLPVFFSGLPEDVEPIKFMAHQVGLVAPRGAAPSSPRAPLPPALPQGCLDLLRHGRGKVLQLVQQLAEPLREALEQERPLMMYRCLEVMRALVRSDRGVGEALVRARAAGWRSPLSPCGRSRSIESCWAQ